MFYRLIGFALIIFTCAKLGYDVGRELKFHLNALEELRQIFSMLRSELIYTRATFEDIFEKIGDKMKGTTGIWLKDLSERLREKKNGTFYDVWITAIDEGMNKNSLQFEDLEELKKMGKHLNHVESIDLYMEQLEYRIKNLRESYRVKGKLYRSIGIMGGIFLVVLLL